MTPPMPAEAKCLFGEGGAVSKRIAGAQMQQALLGELPFPSAAMVAIGLDDNGSLAWIAAAQKVCADPPLGNIANAAVDDAPVAVDLVHILGGYHRQIDMQNGEIGSGANLGSVKKFDA